MLIVENNQNHKLNEYSIHNSIMNLVIDNYIDILFYYNTSLAKSTILDICTTKASFWSSSATSGLKRC